MGTDKLQAMVTTCCEAPSCTPTPMVPAETEADRDLARLLKACAHPVRLRILRCLDEQDACVCGTMVDGLGLPQSTVSQHLKVLKEAGLVQGEVEGRTTCYCLNRAGMRHLRVLLAGL